MILPLFWMGTANAAALMGAEVLLRKVRTDTPSTNTVIFLLIHLALVSGTILVMGTLGLMNATALGLLGAAALALMLALGIRPDWRAWSRPRPGIPMALFCGIVILRLAMQVWYFVPYVPDTLYYHLPKVAEWTRAGAITREVGLDWRANFPAGFELVEIWWVVFLHHEALIEMAGVEFLGLAFAAVYSLSRSLNIGERASFLAATLAAMTPGIHTQATACLNDGAVAALILSAFALLAGQVQRILVLGTVFLGMGVKPTFGFALPGILLLWFLVRRETPPCPGSPRRAMALTLLAAGIGGYWYARNAFLHGNPLHPVSLHGPLPYQDYVLHVSPDPDSLITNILILMNRRLYDPEAISAQLRGISGWGIACFAIGLPALLLAVREDRRFRRLAAGFGCSLASVLAFSTTDAWYLRFTLFFPGILALAAARWSEGARWVRIPAGAALAMLFLDTTVPYEFPMGGVSELIQSPWKERSMSSFSWDPPGHDPVLCVDGAGFFYRIYRPDYSRRVLYARPRTSGEILKLMDQEKVRWVRGASTPLLTALVREGHLRRSIGQYFERDSPKGASDETGDPPRGPR